MNKQNRAHEKDWSNHPADWGRGPRPDIENIADELRVNTTDIMECFREDSARGKPQRLEMGHIRVDDMFGWDETPEELCAANNSTLSHDDRVFIAHCGLDYGTLSALYGIKEGTVRSIRYKHKGSTL